MRSEFAFLDSALERRLFALVELAIIVGVIWRDARVHFRDVVEHHLRGPLNSMRRRVSRKLQSSVREGPPQSFLFRLVEFAILVRIERCDLGKNSRQVLCHGGSISVILSQVVIKRADFMGLCDSKPANCET